MKTNNFLTEILIAIGQPKSVFSIKLSSSPSLEMASSLAVGTLYFALLLHTVCAYFISVTAVLLFEARKPVE